MTDAGNPPRGRRPAAVAETTRRSILEAALTSFAERGYEAVSLRDIAERAGIAHGLIRHHFGGKDALWRAVVDLADGRFAALAGPALEEAAAEPDPVAALGHAVEGLVTASARHPQLVRLLLTESTRGGPRLEQILERMAPLRSALAGLLARLQGEGLVRDQPPEWFFLHVLLAGAAPFALAPLTAAVTGADPLTEEYGRRQAELLMRTLVPGRG
ncbi:TetR/AcrR family transcriptional regulator [Thermoactinospora rubra]|uniref:TetR/AcrR family transcriptional regulator n=1 Tax=Thermoactinospora rubra TaxID=1088767 RepID=UPI001301E79F|nr:TetR/AcrR family transcriptional regulator [Thermoactinospora rubra]